MAQEEVDPNEQEEKKELSQYCESCNQVIVDQNVTVAIGKVWHKQHFRCGITDCDVMLEGDYQIHNTVPYCIKCFIGIVRPKCAKESCGSRMHGYVIFALNKYWHASCFTCTGCDKPLVGAKYYIVEDQPYDLECHWAKRLAIQKNKEGEHS